MSERVSDPTDSPPPDRPHLIAAISGHGYGHLAQLLPVFDILAKTAPTLRLTLRTSLPATLLRERVPVPFELLPGELDFGMRMKSALCVDADASAADYRRLHQDWPQRVAAEARLLANSGADALLADVPYLSVAAARQAGVPAIALCSLNWADIYRHYCGHLPEAARVIEQMLAAYNDAERFLRPQPAMPMPGLHNSEAIEPLARPAPDCRTALRERLSVGADTRLLLVGMGGVGLDLPVADWPRFPGWRLIVPDAPLDAHPDIVPTAHTGLNFPALFGGVDALLTKPGYGTYVEAACQGLPVLYSERPDWPEEPYLAAWLHRHTRAAAISQQSLLGGDFLAALEALCALPAGPPLRPNGARQVADRVLAMLNRSTPTRAGPATDTATALATATDPGP